MTTILAGGAVKLCGMKTIDRIDQVMAEAGVPERSRKKELSRISGVSYESVRKWFTGQTASIETEHLAKIARHYKKSLDWLANGKEPTGQPTSYRVSFVKKEKLGDYLSGSCSAEMAGGNADLIRDAAGAFVVWPCSHKRIVILPFHPFSHALAE